jgi:hypothetical protein
MCDEYPEMYNEIERKARKQHMCCECFNPILKDSVYYDISGMWDGEFDRMRAHKDCHEFYRMLNEQSFTGEPYSFCELIDVIMNELPSEMYKEFRGSVVNWSAENISIIKAKYELSLL